VSMIGMSLSAVLMPVAPSCAGSLCRRAEPGRRVDSHHTEHVADRQHIIMMNCPPTLMAAIDHE